MEEEFEKVLEHDMHEEVRYNDNSDKDSKNDDNDDGDDLVVVSANDKYIWNCPHCDEAYNIRASTIFAACPDVPLQRLVCMTFLFSLSSDSVSRSVIAGLAGVSDVQVDEWAEACGEAVDHLRMKRNHKDEQGYSALCMAKSKGSSNTDDPTLIPSLLTASSPGISTCAWPEE